MSKLGMEEGQPIEHSMITKAIENAQRKVEAHNFDIRKHLLEYDDVMTKQREVIYSQRREVLETDDVHELVQDMYIDVLDELLDTFLPAAAYADDWDLDGLAEATQRQFGVRVSLSPEHVASMDREAVADQSRARLEAQYTAKVDEIGAAQFQELERWVILQVIDKHWKDHLLSMDHLKEGIGLRGYGQKNPLNEYKREGFDLFMDMTERIKTDVVEFLFKAQVAPSDEHLALRQRQTPQRAMARRGSMPGMQEDSGGAPVTTVRRQGEKIGRNAPCPCGSGKKYKKCCGA
jgi:preprotein translocase subunit SecA